MYSKCVICEGALHIDTLSQVCSCEIYLLMVKNGKKKVNDNWMYIVLKVVFAVITNIDID